MITSLLLALSLLETGSTRTLHLQQTSARQVAVAGEDLELPCEVEPDLGGLIVWKHGARVLFAGELKIRRDQRLSLREGR